MDKVIEAMVKAINTYCLYKGGLIEEDDVKELLDNLRYDCIRCKGQKTIGSYSETQTCPKCGGTGEFQKMLAILDEYGRIMEDNNESKNRQRM